MGIRAIIYIYVAKLSMLDMARKHGCGINVCVCVCVCACARETLMACKTEAAKANKKAPSLPTSKFRDRIQSIQPIHLLHLDSSSTTGGATGPYRAMQQMEEMEHAAHATACGPAFQVPGCREENPPLPLSQARRVRTRMSLIAASQSTKPLLPMPLEASPFPCSL